MPKKTNVTVFLEVFNEEERIVSCLKSFTWADEVFVFDKCSTDDTYRLAEPYATEVIRVPYSDASENIADNIASRGSCAWCLFVTASSLMHPKLAERIMALTSDSDFRYDVIGMPYQMYSFGICSAYSPWRGGRKYTLMRQSVLRLSTKLHCEMSYDSDAIYDMPWQKEDEVLYHCTHTDADDFFDKLTRYTKYEASYAAESEQKDLLKHAFYDILKAMMTVVFRRRTWVLGWNGLALSLAYITYFTMKFIHVWDDQRENGRDVYPVLRKKIDRLWAEKK